MALGDILVCLDSSDSGETRLRLAAAIARDQGAQLSAAYLMTEDAEPAAPSTGSGFRQGWMAELSGNGDAARGATAAEIAEQRFREMARSNGNGHDWYLLSANEGDEFVALAKASDLVVLGQSSRDHRVASAFRPDTVVMACGRPMLTVPYAGNFTEIGRRVLVAWDGSREAARAVHDALPLMAHSEAVTVMTVHGQESEFGRDGLGRVTRHLEHHGIAAKPEEALRGELPVSDMLLSRAADLDADLIVAGAYHHSQWREALFGGVSRELLQHMTVPVLMSH